jgi:regulator of RNase E activity RraA
MTKEVGFTIHTTMPRPAPALVERYASFDTANISDSMGRLFTMHHKVKQAYQPMRKLCGPAITVQARPGDNLLGLKAIEIAQPGDVIVISGFEDESLSVWGGFMSMMAARKGLHGVVTDGLVRDVKQTRSEGFPVFAAGITPAAPTKEGSGQINTTINCGRVVVQPGDIVVGDEDGVVVVPRNDAESLMEVVLARIEKERGWKETIESGGTIAIDSANEVLARLNASVR